MRDIPENLATHLGEGVTTLARCWKLLRRDGVVAGFTDHDRDLTFAGVTFRARSGLEAAEASAELGFAVGGGEVAGVLSAASIAEADVAAGAYDDATVETWLVNWSDVAERVLLDVASIGEIRRTEHAFTAELRGVMHRYDEERGRVYRADCAATLGDARCRVALDAPHLHAAGTVTAVDGALGLSSPVLAGFADGWFTGGALRFASGGNAGAVIEVRAHIGSSLQLWVATARPIAVGDAFHVTAGCDRSFATCRAKFGNAVNFRGFPHMPGNDFVIRYPLQGEPGFDGGSLFR
ncbi:DUF2163 domain-containing protein [Pseudochelatococcus contaminans]|uniref:Putative phage protein (TIGR02218 family) n=1 Tax=Pseudochelatococcus contaminans TaxID=1538103 RepID=A0A7W5Z4A7_9HYPH|nr:DUF2163 domain-containing protein [Pseudochelatococcus contaminans]MBB3809580.1 putative phage protein (TIGR02218 family) [Pseudochelatococcus contaminans]